VRVEGGRFAAGRLANPGGKPKASGLGFNATAAFKHAYPNVTHESAMRNASRLLRDAEVAAYRSARMEKVLAPRHMSGDEALARLEMMARVNVHDFSQHARISAPTS
jgi:hypothetical protein